MTPENNSNDDAADDNRPQDVEPNEWTGTDELLAALGQTLRAKSGKEAVAKLINSFAEDNPKRSQRQYRTMLWGYALSAFVIIVIGLLGWLQVLNKETVGTLLGAVVGGLFQRRSG